MLIRVIFFILVVFARIFLKLIWLIPLAKLGAAWLIGAACVGVYWIIDRARINAHPERVRGVRTLEPRSSACARPTCPSPFSADSARTTTSTTSR